MVKVTPRKCSTCNSLGLFFKLIGISCNIDTHRFQMMWPCFSPLDVCLSFSHLSPKLHRFGLVLFLNALCVGPILVLVAQQLIPYFFGESSILCKLNLRSDPQHFIKLPNLSDDCPMVIPRFQQTVWPELHIAF